MKKLKLLIASVLLLSVAGCEKYFEDKIASPNSPSTSSPDLLLTNIQVATFANFSGQLARQGMVFTQHIAGTSIGSQSVEIARYVLTDQTNENEWGVIYSGVLFNGKILLEDFGQQNPYYSGITRIIMAMNLGSATDLWGDVPYSDALKGREGEYQPTYDTQQELLDDTNPNSIFGLLDQAISDLNQPLEANVSFPGSDDLIFGGDIDLWIKTANSLKARYYNRLSQVDPQGSATKALAAINSGAISTPAENCYMKFGVNAGQLNQWYDFEQNRAGYYRMGKYFIELLKANNDPRLPFYAKTDPSGNYTGTPKDSVDITSTSPIGNYLASVGSDIPLVSYTETKFIEAEAELRAGNAGGAADAHNEAVIASVTEVTGATPDAAFITSYASETAATISLETIMEQKYIAMFGQLEAYADFRRTDLPADITPNPNAAVSVIPKRFVTPQNERLYNDNATVVTDVTQPVYWDQ